MDRFRYCGYGGVEYEIYPYAYDCYVHSDGENIAYLQLMTLRTQSLLIEHFAINSAYVGQGLGEVVLRGFADLIRNQLPSIMRIEFDLGKSTSISNIHQLAEARENLLSRIGAVDVQRKYPNKSCIVVSGVWHKTNW